MATGIGQYGFGAKMARYADAGKYYSFTNPTPGTGILGGVVTSLVTTTPLMIIRNGNAVGSGINCALDYVALTVSVVGVGHTVPYMALKIDRSTNARYSSGGTQITPQASGAGAASPNGNCQVYFGAIAAAAEGNAALLGSYRVKGAIEVVLDSYKFDFGGAVAQSQNGLADNSTTISHGLFNFPPVTLGPQQHALLYWFAAANSTGITWFVNGGYVEA